MVKPMPVMPLRDRSTAGLCQLAHGELSRRISTGVVQAGFVDLRPAHGSVMEQLTHEDGLRITDLAARSMMTVQSMGELVDDLETRGYLERRPHPNDRRAKRVFFTDRGREVVSASDIVVRDLERSLENQVGSRRYQQLRSTLLAIAQNDAPADYTAPLKPGELDPVSELTDRAG